MNRRTLLVGAAAGATSLVLPESSQARRRGDGYKTIPYAPVDAQPYFKPGAELLANKDQIDRLIWPSVREINTTGWVWTTQSCQGGTSHLPHPMLRLACREQDIRDLLGAIHDTQVAQTWRNGANYNVLSMWRVNTPAGWAEIGVQSINPTSLWRSINYFNRLAQRLAA